MTKPLEEIIDEVNELRIIYDIHQCNAGWGFVLYKPDGDRPWRECLAVQFYRDSLREAAEDTLEYLRFEKILSDIEL